MTDPDRSATDHQQSIFRDRLATADGVVTHGHWLHQGAELLRHAAVRPATPAYARLSVQLQVMLEAVLTGRLEPPAAVARAAELVGAVTGLPVRGT